jgi:hypothetical protein
MIFDRLRLSANFLARLAFQLAYLSKKPLNLVVRSCVAETGCLQNLLDTFTIDGQYSSQSYIASTSRSL